MNFSFKTSVQTPVTAESLNKRTENILGVFSKTINDLKGVINQAKDRIAVKYEEIKTAEIERQALQNLVDKNEHIVTKLEDFIN